MAPQPNTGLTMQQQPIRAPRPYPLSPSPPSSVSPPGGSKVPALPPPSTNPVWNERPSHDSTSDEGASRFFSSRTSSIGSTNSAGSRSPPRWTSQPQQQPQAQTLHRASYPSTTMFHSTDMHAPTAERELHVVLPEPWMDAPYVLQMAHNQGWDVLDVRMQPHGAVLVFASPAGAARAFAQVNGSVEGVSWIGAGAAARVQAHWAGAVGRANEEEMQTFVGARSGASHLLGSNSGPNASKQLEFSIFVGDLAPETTNADLVAVFRNPLLGLRADREPRVIRPFTSCRSAKIMVSPETGVSKGYGFVRFTDEADQQRALIEMQGLYCLSRPMRLSHATAKTKPGAANGGAGGGYAQDELDPYLTPGAGRGHEMYARLGLDMYGRHHSVSGPSAHELGHHYARSADYTNAVPPRARSVDAEELFNSETGRVLGMEGSRMMGVDSARVLGVEGARGGGGGGLSDAAKLESARALLGVLNSADPYNTTVFVGGLSGLIAEETLRGFFAPFGEIHYVKIPPGKGCGFVQFVRKADAERAIERMQGFPIGGGKIRLSWGRSQWMESRLERWTGERDLEVERGGLCDGKGRVGCLTDRRAIRATSRSESLAWLDADDVKRSISDKAAQAAAQAAQLGLNLGGLHLNSLSAADSARLFQTLDALGYGSIPPVIGGGGQQGVGFQGQQAGAFQGQQGAGLQASGFQGHQAGGLQIQQQAFGAQQLGGLQG
ncbi:RRM protein, partial [Ceratobasidium sp. 392]